MNISLTNWKTPALIAWAVLATLYIIWFTIDSFKMGALQNAYLTGQNDTVVKLIEQASNKECKSFNVYSGDKKVDLVNVACLQQSGAQGAKQPTAPATTPTK